MNTENTRFGSFSDKPVQLQETEWGKIEWLVSPDYGSKAMSAGIVTINPHMTQAPHIHYENEQFIHILKGSGVEYIDGNAHNFCEGMSYTLPANIRHEITNESGEPVVHLLVSVPVSRRNSLSAAAMTPESFISAVEAIRTQLSDASLPVTITDASGKLIYSNRRFPRFCEQHCRLDKDGEICPCYADEDYLFTEDEVGSKFCPHGLKIFKLPVEEGGFYCGNIYSGHVFMSSAEIHSGGEAYDTPKGTVLAVLRWMGDIAQGIKAYAGFSQLSESLRKKDIEAQEGEISRKKLESDLNEMKNKVTNLKINHHFLFNTLNALASQALEGDRISNYQAIVDLSKMFRYSMDSDMRIVPLSSEIEYMNTYIHMQKLRFQGDLDVKVEADEKALDVQVPFNFLQPVIENAFTHGFVDFSEAKKLSITMKLKKDRLVVNIENNGNNPGAENVERVNAAMKSNTGHGMGMVYAKLQSVYGNDFSLEIKIIKNGNTLITAELPAALESEESL